MVGVAGVVCDCELEEEGGGVDDSVVGIAVCKGGEEKGR